MLAFLDGTLPRAERGAVETHVAACSACADLVTWAAADQAASTARLPGHEGRPFVGQLHPGSRVGRYQVLGAVGRGGMGEVYAAYHPDLDRRIALKVVQGSWAATIQTWPSVSTLSPGYWVSWGATPKRLKGNSGPLQFSRNQATRTATSSGMHSVTSESL